MKRNITAVINFISSIFVFLFTYTALSKLLAFHSFQTTLGRSTLVGIFSPVLAIALPLLELTIASLLFFLSTRRAGLVAALVVMVLFSAYIGCSLLLGLKLPCSCGGVFQSLDWLQHLWVNLFLTLLALTAVVLNQKFSQRKLNFSLQ